MTTGKAWRLTSWAIFGFSSSFFLAGVSRFMPAFSAAAIATLIVLLLLFGLLFLLESFFIRALKTDIESFRSVYLLMLVAFITGAIVGAI